MATGNATGNATGRASWLLAAALLALAVADRPPPGATCSEPSEWAGDASTRWTAALACRGPGPEVRGPARLLVGLGLDPNRADAAALETLPGVGPARAAAIVAARPFAGPCDLLRVRGIGPRTLARVEPWLALPPAGASEACPD